MGWRIGMRRAARVFIGMVLAFVAVLAVPQPGRAGPTLVFDVRTGEILHSYNPFTPWHPASLTKLMTAYVTFQAVRQGRVSLNSPVRVSAAALAQPPSKMGFPVGTEITVEYALRILMVKSANDIAHALAESVSGSHDGFIADMNAAARRLGMRDTVYANPHGLHDARQVTTARDIAVLTRALVREFPQHQRFFEISRIQVGQRVLSNHNKLIGRFRGADGMKTGYICASGFNIVATATRGGRRLAAVVLGGMSSAKRNEVTALLLEAGFEAGGGFGLIGTGRPNLDRLQRPASIGKPVDMRPYVCQKRKAPAHLASFGIEEGAVLTTGGASSGDPSRTVEANAGGGLLNNGFSALSLVRGAKPKLDGVATPTDPLVAFDVPLPRPKPSARGGTIPQGAVSQTSATPSSSRQQVPASASMLSLPRPNPRRDYR